MAEKNILAYFNSPEQAEGVASKLKALRVIDMSIDRISRYPGQGVQSVMNPITGDFPSLGKLTLDADFGSKSAAILAAADVSASGMSDGGQAAVTGKDILLTAVVDDSVYDQAIKAIEDAGGMI